MQWLGLVDLDTYSANAERNAKQREQRRLAKMLHATPEPEKVGSLLSFLDTVTSLSVAYSDAVRSAHEEAPLLAQREAERAAQKAEGRAKVEAARQAAELTRQQAKAARDKVKADLQAEQEKAARAAAKMKAAPSAPPPAPLVIPAPDVPALHLPRDPIARAWRTVSVKKRMAWYALGERMARFNSRGVEMGLTGPEAFRSVNRVRESLWAAKLMPAAKRGENAVLCDAPTHPTLPPPLSGDLRLEVFREGGCYGPLRAQIVCKHGHSSPVRVEFGRPEALEACSAGDCHKLDVVGRLDAGATDITALLREQRGTPRVGAKIVAYLTPLSPEGFVNFRVTITATVAETAPAPQQEQLRAA